MGFNSGFKGLNSKKRYRNIGWLVRSFVS